MPDRYVATLKLEPHSTAGPVGVTRRETLKRLGSGALFLFTLREAVADEEKAGPQKHPLLLSRLHIGDDGIVTVLTGKVECGQGIRTTLTQVAAEELRLRPAQVSMLMGDTALVPAQAL